MVAVNMRPGEPFLDRRTADPDLWGRLSPSTSHNYGYRRP